MVFPMMGGLTFMVDDKMCLGVVKESLMARIDPDIYDEALLRNGCREMDFTKRPMKGFVFVDPEGVDMDADLAYSQQVAAYGRKDDVLFAISTSGNSQNVVYAAITARAKGLKVIGLTGQHGGCMKQYCDTAICVPSTITAEIQEYHLPVYHTICRIIESKFF